MYISGWAGIRKFIWRGLIPNIQLRKAKLQQDENCYSRKIPMPLVDWNL